MHRDLDFIDSTGRRNFTARDALKFALRSCKIEYVEVAKRKKPPEEKPNGPKGDDDAQIIPHARRYPSYSPLGASCSAFCALLSVLRP